MYDKFNKENKKANQGRKLIDNDLIILKVWLYDHIFYLQMSLVTDAGWIKILKANIHSDRSVQFNSFRKPYLIEFFEKSTKSKPHFSY